MPSSVNFQNTLGLHKQGIQVLLTSLEMHPKTNFGHICSILVSWGTINRMIKISEHFQNSAYKGLYQYIKLLNVKPSKMNTWPNPVVSSCLDKSFEIVEPLWNMYKNIQIFLIYPASFQRKKSAPSSSVSLPLRLLPVCKNLNTEN